MKKLDWRELKCLKKKMKKMQGLWKRNQRARLQDYDGMCWECWDDQLTEESDSLFDQLM
jgi:hypothetical protein